MGPACLTLSSVVATANGGFVLAAQPFEPHSTRERMGIVCATRRSPREACA